MNTRTLLDWAARIDGHRAPVTDNLTSLPISLEKFTELAHRTASRYSHRSDIKYIAFTFLPNTLEDFHRQVCAAIEASRAAVPAGTDMQWQKRHPMRTDGAWENTNEPDAKWWRDNSQGWEIRMLYAHPVAQPNDAQDTAETLLPHAYLFEKVAMAMPLFQEARDALTAIREDQRIRHGISATLADRMDAAGTFSLADWEREHPVPKAKPEQAACKQTTKKELQMLSISDEQAEAIASEVYARNPVDGIDAAFKLDWELVRAGISHAKAISTEDSCPHGNAHIVHDCLRCGAPVCCGKCCADDATNGPDVAGEIAYQLTKKLVIDMPTARAAVDAAIAALQAVRPLTPAQRRALIDEAGDKTDGLNQDDFADEIVLAVERHHGIASPNPKD